jgi:hypothetical protein
MIVAELVTRALNRAALPGVDAPSARDMENGVDRLNEMLAAWAIDSMDLRQPTLVRTDTIFIDPAHLKCVIDSLAIELAVDHGLESTLSQGMLAGAELGRNRLRAALFEIDDLIMDTAQRPAAPFEFTRG